MGSKGATTTTTSSPPKEVVEMYKYLTEQGKALQQKPYEPYTGQMVADMNKYQQAGLDQAQQYANYAQPYLQKSAQMTQDVYSGYTPQGFASGVQGYMSPYLQNAMGSVTSQMQNVQGQEQQKLLGGAMQAGAFGGDRGKIAQAALTNQQNLALGQTLSTMAQQGYQDAAKNYLMGLGAQGQLASQYGQTGVIGQQQGLAGAQAMMQAGATPYQIEQAKLASQYGQYAQQQAYPWQTLGYLANIASGLGAGQGGTSSTTSPGPNAMSQIFGGLMALGGLPWSDKRLKHDVKEVGETFDGQPIYSFKYNGDHTTHIGLMAQDVEKKHPEAVGLAGGYKTVDYKKATEDAAERGKFNLGGASMGGLVPAGQERQPYATKGAVGATPYLDDPLYALLSEYLKVPLTSVVPSVSIDRGGVGIPEPPKPYEDKESDLTKGLQAMTGSQKGNIVANVRNILNPKNYYTNQGYYITPEGDVFNYAQGGLVPRAPHADGERVAMPDNPVVPLPDVPYGSDKPTIFEHVTGMNLSPDARAGMLAAGLGMMSSRSPFLGTAVGEGGLAGLNTYYNAIKNKYDVQKELAKLGLEKQRIDIDRLTAGTNAYEKVRQLYIVKQDDNGNVHAFTMGGQEIPLADYYADMAEAARLLGLPVERLIQRHARESHASGGRTGMALGGSEEVDRSGLAAAEPVGQTAPTPSIDDQVKSLARETLAQPAATVGVEKPVQMAQAAPMTQTDATQAPQADKLHPTLQRILDLNQKSQSLYKEADDIDAKISKGLLMDPELKSTLAGRSQQKRTQALQYETQANELMKLEQIGPSGIKYRWEYGAEEPENLPPKGVTPESKRGEVDPNTGRITTAPVDLGYSQTGGLPTVKLGKHQVRIGEDPLLAEATKSSQEKLKDFQEKSAGTQEGIVNAIKFAAALKVLQSGALTGNATALGAIAKDLGFDAVADELALGKDIAAAETGLKTQIAQGLATLSQNFARPTQSEFGVITEKASPSIEMRPDAAHSISTTVLGGMLWQNALMRDWQNARANGARNFDAFQNYWRQLNDRSLFEDAAGRLLGNFKGQALTPESKVIEGGVYVLPQVQKGKPVDPQMSDLMEKTKDQDGNYQLSPGDFFAARNVKHYKGPNGEDRVTYTIEKLAPEEIYSTMLRMPGISYGVR